MALEYIQRRQKPDINSLGSMKFMFTSNLGFDFVKLGVVMKLWTTSKTKTVKATRKRLKRDT